jgi:hypothetical protein
MQTLSAEQSRTIAKQYSDLASALADYRFGHWNDLTKAQRAEIESHEWTLLTYSSNMASHAIRLAVNDVGTSTSGIARATQRLVAAARRIASVKQALALAAAAIALGGAIASGHALAIGKAVSDALALADGGRS